MGSNISVKAADNIRAAEKQGSTELILNDCSLDSFPKELVKKFKTIKKLVLSTNYIQSLPKQISGFDALEVLKIDNNEIPELPKEILDISTLIYINAARNQMVKFPEPIEKLSNLKKLDLSGNKFQELPFGLSSLPLETFKFGYSNISEVPDVIYSMKSLTSLHLAGMFLCASLITSRS